VILFLVLLILALALGGLLATLMMRDPGYVLVSYDGSTVETSLWFAAAVLVVGGLVVYGMALLVRRLVRGRGAISDWVRSRRATTARNRSVRGLMLFAEGRWQEARQAFLAGAERVDTPLFNHLAAARAANELQRFEDRDDILARAREATPQASFAIELVRAELQQAAGQWARSVATLDALQREAPRHPVVVRRLFEARKALGDWEAVAEMASELPKDADLEGAETEVWRARLARSRNSADAVEHARNTFKAAPKKLRDDEALVLDYVDALAADVPGEAEAALRAAIKRQWQASWVRRYGTLDADPAAQLAHALGWSKRNPEDASLLLTLGRLSAATGDEAKAREYLEASLARKADAETLEELGRLCARNGEAVAAVDHYKRALRLATAAERAG